MAPITEVGKLLKTSNVISGLSDDIIDNVASRMTELHLKDGDILVKEGQPMPGMFLIESGVLDRVILSSEDAEKETEFQVDCKEAGATTGLLHVLHDDAFPAFATVRARGNVKVWSLKAKDLQSMLRGNPDFAMSVISSLAEDLRGKTKALAHLINSPSKTFEGVKVICYDSAGWVRENFQAKADLHNKTASPKEQIVVDFTSDTLSTSSVASAVGYDVACLFVNDVADAEVLKSLGVFGVGMIAMRI